MILYSTPGVAILGSATPDPDGHGVGNRHMIRGRASPDVDLKDNTPHDMKAAVPGWAAGRVMTALTGIC